MFTCKTEGQFAVYMMRDSKTGNSYIGSATDIRVRLEAHMSNLKNRKAKDAYSRRLQKTFPKFENVEFRILEFVESSGATLRDRENYWICELKPSANRNSTRRMIAVEDLPYGAPEPHHTGKLHNGDPREMVAATK